MILIVLHKQKISSQRGNDGTKALQIMAPLKVIF